MVRFRQSVWICKCKLVLIVSTRLYTAGRCNYLIHICMSERFVKCLKLPERVSSCANCPILVAPQVPRHSTPKPFSQVLLDTGGEAVAGTFVARPAVKVELLVLCQADLVVEAVLISIFQVVNFPKFTRQTSWVLVEDKEVLIVDPDEITKPVVKFKHQSIVGRTCDSP